jgi:uncharacterized protein YutE (UPF0331/DUF86 family)
MVKRDVISKKVNQVRHHLERISFKSNISLEELLNNEDERDIVCHNLFVMLQYIIDICLHIISDKGFEEPVFLSDMPKILVKEKVVREQLEQPLKNMMGLRKIIAHQYGDIDFKTIYKIARNDLNDGYVFLEDIIKYAQL